MKLRCCLSAKAALCEDECWFSDWRGSFVQCCSVTLFTSAEKWYCDNRQSSYSTVHILALICLLFRRVSSDEECKWFSQNASSSVTAIVESLLAHTLPLGLRFRQVRISFWLMLLKFLQIDKPDAIFMHATVKIFIFWGNRKRGGGEQAVPLGSDLVLGWPSRRSKKAPVYQFGNDWFHSVRGLWWKTDDTDRLSGRWRWRQTSQLPPAHTHTHAQHLDTPAL